MVPIEEGFPSETLIRMPVESQTRMQGLPLCRALRVTDAGHYPEARNHLVKREKECPNHILIYCQSGQGFCAIGEKRHLLHEGQAVLIPAHEPHSYGSGVDSAWRIYWIHFNGHDSAELLNLLTDNRQANIVYLPRPATIVSAFDDTIRWTKRSHSNANLIALSGACARLLSLVLEGKRPNAERARQVEERVRSTIDRMRQTLRMPLTLDQLAEEAALSIPQYSAVFRKQVGNSPMQLYAQIRIQKACELLHDTKLPIRIIADETGYPDAYYFSRTFKRIMGIAPSDYRKATIAQQPAIFQTSTSPLIPASR